DLAGPLGVAVGADAVGQIEAVREALRSGSLRWLIVVDDADDPAQLRGLLPNGAGHLLVTSRNPGWSNEMHTFDVGVFSREQSTEMLARRVAGLPPTDADHVADKVGDLPLAIEQAGAYLATTGLPVQTYLDMLDTRTDIALDEYVPP